MCVSLKTGCAEWTGSSAGESVYATRRARRKAQVLSMAAARDPRSVPGCACPRAMGRGEQLLRVDAVVAISAVTEFARHFDRFALVEYRTHFRIAEHAQHRADAVAR